MNKSVCVNQASSSWAAVTSGLRQGRVLGPILFTLFVNEMPESVLSKIKLFADDTKLYRTVCEASDCETLQEDLNKLLNWAT